MRRTNWSTLLVASSLALGVGAISPTDAQAELRLPSIFSEGMVLQRDRENSIWGWGDAGESLSIAIADYEMATVVGADGKWMAPLPALSANADGLTITVRQGDGEEIVISDVLVGEVWLCSGQSNMAWSLANTQNAAEEIAVSADPLFRFFQVTTDASSRPVDDVPASWVAANPENAGTLTAVGYYFGKDLRQSLDVPVGIIRSAYGGTIAEPWISRETYETAPELDAYRERISAMEVEHPGLMESFDQEYARRMELQRTVTEERNRLRSEGVPQADWPAAPGVPTMEPGGRYLPAVLHNAMIAPLVPYGVRGFTWYQGESNGTYFNEHYAATMNTLVEDWRRLWGGPEMPFLIVQLANFRAMQESPTAESSWANIREAQRQVDRDNPGVGMIVTIDVGEADDIHPRDKRTVGERLARLARVEVYGDEEGLLPAGPQFAAAMRTDEGVFLRFANAAEGLRLRDGESVKGITIHAEGMEPVFAEAQIVSNSAIFVRTPGIEGDVIIRHAWADNPIWNVVNTEGMPLEPFQVTVEQGER